MYDNYFSNIGRPPVPDDLSKDSAPRHPMFWRRKFLKVFIKKKKKKIMSSAALVISTSRKFLPLCLKEEHTSRVFASLSQGEATLF